MQKPSNATRRSGDARLARVTLKGTASLTRDQSAVGTELVSTTYDRPKGWTEDNLAKHDPKLINDIVTLRIAEYDRWRNGEVARLAQVRANHRR